MPLTQIGIHDKEVKVLLEVAAMFRNLSSEQVEYSSQQMVTKAEIITALMYEEKTKVNRTVKGGKKSLFLKLLNP